MTSNRPTASLVIITYQQERYIRDAVMSALAQTYSPLEIIISDDCSTDGTFEIMKEAVAGYKGPHEVRLNRNTQRLYMDHNNVAIGMARGDFVVYGQGDDISMPQRTDANIRAWLATGAGAIASNCVIINAEGQPQELMRERTDAPDVSLERFLDGPTAMCVGCAIGWAKAVWDTFGPLPKSRNEDWLIPFWGLLLGGNHYINEPLVAYRVHGKNMALGWKKAETEAEKLLLAEAQACQRAGNSLFMLDAVKRLRTLRPDDPLPARITPVLDARLHRELRDWVSLRYDIGQREIGVF